MRIKLDENLPRSLAVELSRIGHQADAVYDENLAGVADDRLWEAAQQEERFFITQDLDFSDVRQFQPGTHFGILLIRLREPGKQALINLVMRLFKIEDTSSWRGCFVIATERKVRIRRPGHPFREEN